MKYNYGIGNEIGIVDLGDLENKIGKDGLVKAQILMRDGQDLEKNNFMINVRFKELIRFLEKEDKYITVIEELDGYILRSERMFDSNSITEYKIIEAI